MTFILKILFNKVFETERASLDWTGQSRLVPDSIVYKIVVYEIMKSFSQSVILF